MTYAPKQGDSVALKIMNISHFVDLAFKIIVFFQPPSLKNSCARAWTGYSFYVLKTPAAVVFVALFNLTTIVCK